MAAGILTGDVYRRIAIALFILAAAAAGGLVGYLAGASQIAGPPTVRPIDPVLDGTADLQPEALGELALDRAAMGARWLASVARDDGSFFYIYYPEDDEYQGDDYNEVRHAGTTYSLFSAYAASDDDSVLEAAEGGARYIADNSVVAGDRGRAFVYQDRMKLGGQALALVALLERRRVLADTTYDDLIGDLARFMLSMELPDQAGRYHQSYDAAADELSLEPDSDYYPGEALLALIRLAQQFPDGPYLEHATRAARYLIYERDGDIPAAGEIPREDHWLTMAIAELYRLDSRPEYRDVAYLQGESMVGNQHGADGPGLRIGGSDLQEPINYTSTATKGEALLAVWALAAFVGDADREARYATAARRNVQFQLRVQYTPEDTELFPRPEAVVGAWGKDAMDPWIRIDFVQHNVSALIGLWHLTSSGDLPIARPFEG
jgi:hypothetical protein